MTTTETTTDATEVAQLREEVRLLRRELEILVRDLRTEIMTEKLTIVDAVGNDRIVLATTATSSTIDVNSPGTFDLTTGGTNPTAAARLWAITGETHHDDGSPATFAGLGVWTKGDPSVDMSGSTSEQPEIVVYRQDEKLPSLPGLSIQHDGVKAHPMRLYRERADR